MLTVSAPGRICLFGEHQDYHDLPVIASAINLRIALSGEKRKDPQINIDLPDIGEKESIRLSDNIEYVKERDYFRSALNVLERNGLRFENGFECEVKGSIPINAGTSSSSALIVAWVKFLLEYSGDQKKSDPMEIAKLAHASEVLEFNEPGGMMDQFISSFGGTMFIDFYNNSYERLSAKMGKFVLGNSKEPKDTKGILARVKHGAIDGINKITKKNQSLSLKNIKLEELEDYKQQVNIDQYEVLKANIINRELTKEAKVLLLSKECDHNKLGDLLTKHYIELRDRCRISTPKIDRMLDAALKAGALGGKINGSGGGGCMFAYAPDNAEEVAEAITNAGGDSYILSVDEGVKVM